MSEQNPYLVWISYQRKSYPVLCSGGSRGPAPPPYFWTKLRLEGPKKNFLRLPSPLLSQALDDCPAPLSEGLCAHSLMPE